MDLFLKFLILSSKYLSHLTAQSIVQAYRRSLQLGRSLNYQYNRRLSVLTNYENVLELYNANLEEFQRINPNAHLAFISEEHRQEFESYLKDVDLLEDSVARKSTYIEQLKQSIMNATKMCVTNVIQFSQELDEDGNPSPRRTNEDSKLPTREARESFQLSPRSMRIMPQGQETLDHIAEFINNQSQYIKDANDNFRQLQAEIARKYEDLERNRDEENEQDSDKSDFSERLKMLQETVQNCAKLMKVVQDQFDRHEANLNTQKLFASIDTIITEVEHITAVLRVNEDQFQKLEHFINLKAKGSHDEDTAKLIHLNLDAYNKLVCKLMQKESGTALNIKPDEVPDLSHAIPIANTVKLFLFHEEQRNMAAVLEANQKAFDKFELSMKYPLIGRWNNKTKRLMRGGPRPRLPNKINDRTSKRHSFGKSPFSKRKVWRKQSNFLCPYSDEFTAQNYAALSSSWLKDEQNSNMLNVEMNEICVDYKFDKSPESMVTEDVPFEMYAASANLEDDNNETGKDSFIFDPHLDILVDQLLSATKCEKEFTRLRDNLPVNNDGLIKTQSIAPYSTQTAGSELNGINSDKNNMEQRLQALRMQSARANINPKLMKMKPAEHMEYLNQINQKQSEAANNINFTWKDRTDELRARSSDTDAIHEMDITITCNDLSLDNDSIIEDVHDRDLAKFSSFAEEPPERFIDVLKPPKDQVSSTQFGKPSNEMLPLECQQKLEQVTLNEQQKKVLFQQEQQQVAVEVKQRLIHSQRVQEQQQQEQHQKQQIRNNETVNDVQSPVALMDSLRLGARRVEQNHYEAYDTISLSPEVSKDAEIHEASASRESAVAFTADSIDVAAVIREMTEELGDENMLREMQEGNKLQAVTEEMTQSANQLVHEFTKQKNLATHIQRFLSSSDLKSTSGSITVTVDQLDADRIVQAGSELRNDIADDSKETGSTDNVSTILTSNEEQSTDQQSLLSQHQLSLSTQLKNLEKAKQQLQTEIDIPAIMSDLNGILMTDKKITHSSTNFGPRGRSDKLKKSTTKLRKVVKSHAMINAKSRDKTILTPNATQLKANTRRISSNKSSNNNLLCANNKVEKLKLDMSTNRKGSNIKLPITLLKLPKLNKNPRMRNKSVSDNKSDVSVSRSYRFDTAKPIIKSMLQNMTTQIDSKPTKKAINLQETKICSYSRTPNKAYSKNVSKDQRELNLRRTANTIPTLSRIAINQELKLAQYPEEVIDFKNLKEHLNSKVLNVDEQKTLSVDDYVLIDHVQRARKQGSDRSRSDKDNAGGANHNIESIDMMSQVPAIQMATEKTKSCLKFRPKNLNPIKSSPVVTIKPSRKMIMASKKSASAATASRPVVRTPMEEEKKPKVKPVTKDDGNHIVSTQIDAAADAESEFMVPAAPPPALSTVDRVTENLRELSAQNMPVQEVKINLVVNPADVEIAGKTSDDAKSMKSGDSVLEIEGENIEERAVGQQSEEMDKLQQKSEGELIKTKHRNNLEHGFNFNDVTARNIKTNEQMIDNYMKGPRAKEVDRNLDVINEYDIDIKVTSDTRDFQFNTPELKVVDPELKEMHESPDPFVNEARIKQKGRLGYMKIINPEALQSKTKPSLLSPYKMELSEIAQNEEEFSEHKRIHLNAVKAIGNETEPRQEDKISLRHYDNAFMNIPLADPELPMANISTPFIVSKPTPPKELENRENTTKNLIEDFRARLTFIRTACESKSFSKTKQISQHNLDTKPVGLIAATTDVLHDDYKAKIQEVQRVLSRNSSKLAIQAPKSYQRGMKDPGQIIEVQPILIKASETPEQRTNVGAKVEVQSMLVKPSETRERKTNVEKENREIKTNMEMKENQERKTNVEKKENVEKKTMLNVSKLESLRQQIEEKQQNSPRKRYEFDSKIPKSSDRRNRNIGYYAITPRQMTNTEQKSKITTASEPPSVSKKTTSASGIKAKSSGNKSRTFDKSKINSAKLHQFSINKSFQDDIKVPKLVMRDITTEMNSSTITSQNAIALLNTATNLNTSNKVDHETNSLYSKKSGIKPPSVKISPIRSFKNMQLDSMSKTKIIKLREFARNSLKPMPSKKTKNSDVSITNFSNCAAQFVESKAQEEGNIFTDVAPPSEVVENVIEPPNSLTSSSPKCLMTQNTKDEFTPVKNELDVDCLYADAIKTQATCVQYENHLLSAVNNPAYMKLMEDLNSFDNVTTARRFNAVTAVNTKPLMSAEIVEKKEPELNKSTNSKASESQFLTSPRSRTQRALSNSPRGIDAVPKLDHQRPRSCGIPRLTAHKMFVAQKSPTIIPKSPPSIAGSITGRCEHEKNNLILLEQNELKSLSKTKQSERKSHSSVKATPTFQEEQETFIPNAKSNKQCVSESKFKEPVIEGHESFISVHSPRTNKKCRNAKEQSPFQKTIEPEMPPLKDVGIDSKEEVPSKLKFKSSERERNLKRLIIMDEKIKTLERDHAKKVAQDAGRFDKTLVTVIEEMRQKKSLKLAAERLKHRSTSTSFRETQSNQVLANVARKVPKAASEIITETDRNFRVEDNKRDAKPAQKIAALWPQPNSPARKESDALSTGRTSVNDTSSPQTRITVKLVPSLHQSNKKAMPKLSALVTLTAMKQKIERQNKVEENIVSADDLLKDDLDTYSLPRAKRKSILPPLAPELKNVQIVEPKRDRPTHSATDRWSSLSHTAHRLASVAPNNVDIISEDAASVSIKMLKSPRDLNTSIGMLHESQRPLSMRGNKRYNIPPLLSPSEQYFAKHSQFNLQKLRVLKTLQDKVKEQNEEISIMKKADKTQKKWMFVAQNQNINRFTNNFGQQLVRVKFNAQRDKCYDAEEYHRNLTKHLESLSSFARIERDKEDNSNFVYRPPTDNGGIREARKPSLSDVKATIMKHLRLGS